MKSLCFATHSSAYAIFTDRSVNEMFNVTRSKLSLRLPHVAGNKKQPKGRDTRAVWTLTATHRLVCHGLNEKKLKQN